METTERGFGIYAKFKDGYGNIVRVQESSNVYGGIWIFCDLDPEYKGNPYEPSPHLTLENAQTMIEALQQAIDHQNQSTRIWRDKDDRD